MAKGLCGYVEFFFENFEFMMVIALTFSSLQVSSPGTISREFALHCLSMRRWSGVARDSNHLSRRHELRQFRVPEDPVDAWSGEEYFGTQPMVVWPAT